MCQPQILYNKILQSFNINLRTSALSKILIRKHPLINCEIQLMFWQKNWQMMLLIIIVFYINNLGTVQTQVFINLQIIKQKFNVNSMFNSKIKIKHHNNKIDHNPNKNKKIMTIIKLVNY